MGIASLGDSGPIGFRSAGMFPGSQSQIGRIDIAFGKPCKVASLNDQRKCGVSFNPKEAPELFHLLLVPALDGEFLDSLVEPFNLCAELIERGQVLIEYLTVQGIQFYLP